MEHFESIIVNRPAREVWALVGHPRAWSAWSPGIQDVETTPEGVLAAGSTVRYRTRSRELHATITEYVEQRLLGIRASEERYDFWESITLRPEGPRTKVTFRMGFAPKGPLFSALAVLVWPVKRWLLGPPLRKDLGALRAAAERGSAAVPS